MKKSDFPYAETYLATSVAGLIDNIKTCEYVTVIRDDTLDYPRELIKKLASYLKADILVNLFTEKARMKASVYGYKSPIESWNNPLIYRAIMNKAEELQRASNTDIDVEINDVDAYFKREAIYNVCREANAFSTVISKTIYDLFLSSVVSTSNHVFDPFGGWGDRMLGALCSSHVTTYTCVDSNPNLESGYTAIQTHDTSRCKLHFHIQDIMSFFEDNKKCDYDLIFTSPPYYNYETYTTTRDKNQSVYGYTTYQSWLTGFIKPLMHELVNILAADRYMLLHAGNTKKALTFVNDILNIGKLLGLTFIQYIHCRGNKTKRSVPILVFHKMKK